MTSRRRAPASPRPLRSQSPLALTLAVSAAGCLAECEFEAGDSETALRLMADVLATYATLKSGTPGLATQLINMAGYLVRLGRYDEASIHAIEALTHARGLRMAVLVANALHHLGVVSLLRPQAQASRASVEYFGIARIFGFAHRNTLSIDSLRQAYDRALAALRDAIGADELARQMTVGRTMTEDNAIAQAQALEY
jgi:tetratricopeptide (TPR) repeat protein